jgi:hypothetical protein
MHNFMSFYQLFEPQILLGMFNNAGAFLILKGSIFNFSTMTLIGCLNK